MKRLMRPTKKVLTVRKHEQIDLRLATTTALDIRMGGETRLDMGLTVPPAGTTDYDKLRNRPRINGVVLSGDQTVADLDLVSENTTEGWTGMTDYVPKAGEICLYTDAWKIKIGDGSAPIVDLPFIGDKDLESVRAALDEHVHDMEVHVSAADRTRWDNKLNLSMDGETLVLNRL